MGFTFLSTGIRFRFRFSSRVIGLGRVSLLIGNSIFPKIFGPSNFSALIFSIAGGASSATGATGATASTTGEGFSTGIALGADSLAGTGLGGVGGSCFFTGFLGRVEESIEDKSILLMTLGPSISGVSIFTISVSTIGVVFC